MFRDMRRSKQQLSQEEAIEVLERNTSGVLAVFGDDGYPYAVPLSYVYIDGKIYFHSALTGHKIDALEAYDKVSFCVVDADDVAPSEYTTYFRSVIAFGRARILRDEQEKMAALRLLGEKYNPGQPDALDAEAAHGFSRLHMIELTIEHLTGKQAKELAHVKGPLDE